MKRFLLPAICIVLIFTSCKKKSEVIPVGTLSADIGGTTMTFNAYATYSIPVNSTNNQLNIGANTSAGSSANFNIWIHPSGGQIVKGTYTNAGLGNNPDPIVGMDYIYPRPSGTGTKLYLSDPNNVQPVSITITSITASNVQGTFTAALLDDDNRTKTLSVINGKFNVNIRNRSPVQVSTLERKPLSESEFTEFKNYQN
ncbi:MAG TPA: hypothetical protein VHB54_06975 [Mucilaginibacter sp.]|nr:hypothetical protein [Mucilaginibacter sp.]